MLSQVDAADLTAGVTLPWGVWRVDALHHVALPGEWSPVMCAMTGAAALSPAEIDDALGRPIGAEPIERIAVGARKVAIAIDDLTRPTPTALMLPHVLRRLQRAGVAHDCITVIVATGAHRWPVDSDLELKVGGVRRHVAVIAHDPAGDLVDTGEKLGGIPVRLNRTFMESDVRIGMCGVIPHPFAAFSGGGKIVIPGLASLGVLARTHKFALMGLKGGHQLDGNRFRTEMEEVVRRTGLQWTVNVAINGRREPVGVTAGDLVAAHRAAVKVAERTGATAPPAQPLDALVLNAYPKDGELLQIEAAFVALRSGMMKWLRPGAPIVLTASCVDGLGHHGLFGPGGSLFRTPGPKTFLADHPLLVYTPGVDGDAFAKAFWCGYRHFRLWSGLVEHLQTLIPRSASIGVVPCGPLQLATECP